MNGMIAICENPLCGAIFEFNSLIGGPGSANIRMINSKVGPCPNCGKMGVVPDGEYEYKNFLYSFVNGPKESIEVLTKIKLILENYRSNIPLASKQDIISEIEKLSPRIAEVAKNAPVTSKLHQWLSLIIATLSLLITIQQTYLKPKENIPDNKISEMFIQHLLDENKDLIRENKGNAVLRVDSKLSRKIGRNDPCPCKSGLKYKKCCGKNK